VDVKQGMGDGVRTLRLTVQYDGSDFAGYQLQSRARTVQGVLHEAFQRLTGEDVRANAAGRTDAGVHAMGQVVSVQTRTALAPQVVGRALNALLPADVAVSDTVDAPPGFHARYSALAREYRYVVYNGPTPGPLWRRYSYHVGDPLDATRMDAALGPLVGRHDFGSFGRGMEDRISGVRGSTVRKCVPAHDDPIAGRNSSPGGAGPVGSRGVDCYSGGPRPGGRRTQRAATWSGSCTGTVLTPRARARGFAEA